MKLEVRKDINSSNRLEDWEDQEIPCESMYNFGDDILTILYSKKSENFTKNTTTKRKSM